MGVLDASTQPAAVNLASLLPLSPGNIDYSPYLTQAIARLPAQGGAIYIPSAINNGVLGLASTVPVRDNVRLFSDHPRALKFIKLADVPLFDLSGQPTGADGSISGRQRKAVALERFTLSGSELDGTSGSNRVGGYGAKPNPAWSAPLVLCHYSQFHEFRKVWFRNNYGRAAYGVKWWDCEFNSCRFDFIGNESSTDPHFAVHAARKIQGVAAGAYGDADDNSNNINFTGQTVFESCRSGHIWIDGRRADGSYQAGDSVNQRFHFGPMKMETRLTTYAPFIKCTYAQILRFEMVDMVTTNTATQIGGYFELDGVTDCSIRSLDFQSTAPSSSSGFGSFFRSRNTSGLYFDLMSGYVDAGNKPSVALIDIDSTNSSVALGRWRYFSNPGGAPLTSIGGATFEYLNTGRGLKAQVAPSATSLGSVARKIEIVDNTNAVLGYVPIYNTIT